MRLARVLAWRDLAASTRDAYRQAATAIVDELVAIALDSEELWQLRPEEEPEPPEEAEEP